jgi:hypothetical protein
MVVIFTKLNAFLLKTAKNSKIFESVVGTMAVAGVVAARSFLLAWVKAAAPVLALIAAFAIAALAADDLFVTVMGGESVLRDTMSEIFGEEQTDLFIRAWNLMLDDMVEAIYTADFSGAFDDIADWFANAWFSVVETVGFLTDAISDVVEYLFLSFDEIIDYFRNISWSELFLRPWIDAINNLRDFLAWFYEDLKSSPLGEIVRDTVLNAFDSVHGFFDDLSNEGAETFQEIEDFVTKTWDSFVEKTDALDASILSFLESIKTAFLSTFESIGNAIDSVVSLLENSLSGLGAIVGLGESIGISVPGRAARGGATTGGGSATTGGVRRATVGVVPTVVPPVSARAPRVGTQNVDNQTSVNIQIEGDGLNAREVADIAGLRVRQEIDMQNRNLAATLGANE